MLFDLEVEPGPAEFHGQRATSALTVLSGANNSGKSAFLKGLKQHLGRTAYFMGPVRFYHVHHIGSQPRNENELNELEQQFISMVRQQDQNYETNFLDLSRILVSLTDSQRDKLLALCSDLIGGNFTLRQVDPTNRLSMHYVDIDGTNLGHASTGTRLLMTLLGTCMDTRFSTMLIDEPELGLSPKVQRAFADFLQDPAARREVFPHLANVYLATHSHLFLDRRELTNNFVVIRDGRHLTVQQVGTISELHQLQFNMLGNDLETIFLPAAIVVVEGKTDHRYVERLIELHFPTRRITVISGSGDVKAKVHSIRETFGGGLQTSPYRDRLFVVVDSVHDVSLRDGLITMGLPPNHIVIWSENGIEYAYPPSLLADIFSCDEEAIGEMTISGDLVRLRGIELRKVELCERVVARLTAGTALPSEVEEKLIAPLRSAIHG